MWQFDRKEKGRKIFWVKTIENEFQQNSYDTRTRIGRIRYIRRGNSNLPFRF